MPISEERSESLLYFLNGEMGALAGSLPGSLSGILEALPGCFWEEGQCDEALVLPKPSAAPSSLLCAPYPVQRLRS